MTVYGDGDLAKLQSIELDMLRVVDEFCREHDISYFLDGGTCIGAVRHGGFIPWDDDIDIGMMREDYEHFIKLFQADPPQGYSVHTFSDTPGYSYMFAKVYKDGTKFYTRESIDAGLDSCIYLDVFPYDYVDPSLSDKSLLKLINRALFWQRMMYLRHTARPAIQPTARLRSAQKALCRVAHGAVKTLFTMESLVSRYDACVNEICGKATLENARLICCIQDFGPLRKDDILPPAPVEFGGWMFPAPCNLDAYLSAVYGDYMTLPPEDKRKTHAPEVIDFGE